MVDAFTIAAVSGDSTTAGQAFAPAGWTAIPAVTASNGTDHTCDVVLTAAWTITSASVSVTGTASSAEDLSGSIIGVQVDAASPIPAVSGVSPGWAGRTILEAALGAGFQTPADEMTWTTLNDSALTPQQEAKCFWAWEESSTGVPYGLGQLQSSEGSIQLDNAGENGGNFTPSNAAGAYFPDVTTGTPLRLRFALGSYGGVAVNRWYAWQRNALDWTEKRDDNLRNYVQAGLTDGWSVVSAPCLTPFRGEVTGDNPQSWYAMDDQPLAGGVQPTSLRNSAAGNSTPLVIYGASGGVTAGSQYTTSGYDATPDGGGLTGLPVKNPPPSVATYQVAQQQGWMYGDPQASPSSYSTGNPVTASPGSAAWQQTGLLGTGGANGWFMAANDVASPPLAAGASFELWWNPALFGSATGFTSQANSTYDLTSQPYSQITLAELATSSAPVAILYLDLSGHLILETFSGSTGTTHTIYNSSDLRSGSWHQVVITATTTAWTVYVDGGLTALVSGTATGMTSAWNWLVIGADLGSSGGSGLSGAQHMGNVAYSHAIVCPGVLPAWRVMARYAAAITGFGQLPAPQTMALSTVTNRLGGVSYTPDGSVFQGSYGVSGGAVTAFTFSALAVATAGAYTSGPSARATIAALGGNVSGTVFGTATWASWTSLSPGVTVYTSAAADAETSAATVCGSGDSFTSGYGSGAVDAGVCSTGGGTGAAPPAGASALGDPVCSRLERILQYGGYTAPNRAMDATATALVQAALDVGGQAAGANCSNIVSSDYGMLFVDNGGTLSYRSRSHMNADPVVWNLSSAGPQYGYPFATGMEFTNDPQYVVNVIAVAPYSPDGSTPAALTPANAAAAKASIAQCGPKPLSIGTTNYLQDPAEIQAAVDWLLASFGQLERRAQSITVDAAQYPQAWPFVLGVNVSDEIQITDLPLQGGPLSAGTYRVSLMSRRVAFGANGSTPEGSVTLTVDPVVPFFS